MSSYNKRRRPMRPVIVNLQLLPQPQPDPTIIEALRKAGYTVERRFGITYVIVPIEQIASMTVVNEVQRGQGGSL